MSLSLIIDKNKKVKYYIKMKDSLTNYLKFLDK